MNWIDFDKSKFHHQKLPKERRHMLVQVAAKPDEGLQPAVAVGYLKFAAGCKDSPYFVIPGVGGFAMLYWPRAQPPIFLQLARPRRI